LHDLISGEGSVQVQYTPDGELPSRTVVASLLDGLDLSGPAVLPIGAFHLLRAGRLLAGLSFDRANGLVDCALDLVLEIGLPLVTCCWSALLGDTSASRALLGSRASGLALAHWFGGDGCEDSRLRIPSSAACLGHC